MTDAAVGSGIVLAFKAAIQFVLELGLRHYCKKPDKLKSEELAQETFRLGINEHVTVFFRTQTANVMFAVTAMEHEVITTWGVLSLTFVTFHSGIMDVEIWTFCHQFHGMLLQTLYDRSL